MLGMVVDDYAADAEVADDDVGAGAEHEDGHGCIGAESEDLDDLGAGLGGHVGVSRTSDADGGVAREGLVEARRGCGLEGSQEGGVEGQTSSPRRLSHFREGEFGRTSSPGPLSLRGEG